MLKTRLPDVVAGRRKSPADEVFRRVFNGCLFDWVRANEMLGTGWSVVEQDVEFKQFRGDGSSVTAG